MKLVQPRQQHFWSPGATQVTKKLKIKHSHLRNHWNQNLHQTWTEIDQLECRVIALQNFFKEMQAYHK